MKKKIAVTILLAGICIYAFAQDRNLCSVTREEIQDIELRVLENIRKLKKEGKLDTSNWEKLSPGMAQQSDPSLYVVPTTIRFAWPMRPRYPEEFQYYHIGNYIDLDSTGNECIRDYNGGYRTYDGHRGTDIGIGPYSWERKKNASVYAVAAAPGVIVEKLDGRYDEQCTWNNGDSPNRGNHVVILHNDGHTVSYYMHLRQGSVTTLNVGDPVTTGVVLGTIASSGNSTGPHLHFQVNTGYTDSSSGRFVDPWAGPSNYTTSTSLWLNQKPYNEPAIYEMETHLGSNLDWYTNDACDKTVDLSTLRNSFSPGNTVGMRSFFRDWIDDSKLSVGVRRPDGSPQATWINVANGCYYYVNTCKTSSVQTDCRLKFIEHNFTIPADAPAGTWTYWVTFGGVTYNHYFSVNCQSNILLTTAQTGSKGFRVSNNITSSSTISSASTNNVRFHADNAVILTPGFTATQGCTFRATNYGCNRLE